MRDSWVDAYFVNDPSCMAEAEADIEKELNKARYHHSAWKVLAKPEHCMFSSNIPFCT